MADSAALRSRRKRQHAAGNHVLCRDGRCESVALPPDGRVALPGMVEAAVRAFVARRQFEPGDHRGVSSVVAIRLAQVVDLEGAPMAARELAGVVKYLADWGDLPGGGDVLDELNARGHVASLDAVMRQLQVRLSTPVYEDGR
jgi:hypothetical protein